MSSVAETRPGSVRVAAVLLRAVAAGFLLDAVFMLSGAGGFTDDVQRRAQASGVAPEVATRIKPFATAVPIVAAFISIIAAVVLLACASTVRKGSYAGRVVTWIAIGLALSCNLCAFGSSGSPGFSGVGYVNASSADSTGQHVFAERVPEGYPMAYRIFATTFGVGAMIALIVVIVLLARGPANQFFRRTPPMPRWAPPQPYGAIPPVMPGPAAMPGQPIAPAHPYGFASPSGPTPVSPSQRGVTLTAEQQSQLHTLARQRERGEITEDQFRAARQQVTGSIE